MKDGETHLWTIEELDARVAEALAVGYQGVPNGRVRDVPDLRTIRYYTTLGLIDRPAEVRGRTALYGWRHLRQLVAIKRLQARGLSLAEIQHRLVGLSDSALERIANPPTAEAETEAADNADTTTTAPAERSRAFWREPPEPLADNSGRERLGRAEAPALSAPLGRTRDRGGNGDEPAAVRPLAALRLGDEATLLLEARRPIDEEDVRAIRRSAAPLLELLQRRGLIGPAGRGTSP